MATSIQSELNVIINGKSSQFDRLKYTNMLNRLINTYKPLDISTNIIENIIDTLYNSIYDNIQEDMVSTELSKICLMKSTLEPNLSFLGGRMLIDSIESKITLPSFSQRIQFLHEHNGIISPTLIKFVKEHPEIDDLLNYERNYRFDYFGLTTLMKSYLMKVNGVHVETPQDMYARVALAITLHVQEEYLTLDDILKCFKETYDALSLGYYTHATPTMFNAGTVRQQLSSCFLISIEDSLEGISKCWHDCSQISKWSGGIGLHVSNIRAKNSLIRGTGGQSNGLVPLLKVFNEIARFIDQGGKRPGSIAVFLEPHHPDVLEFLELKKNTGAETERTRDLFLSMYISDKFMNAVENDLEWYLMSPDVCPGLNDVWGNEYGNLYDKYVSEKKYSKVVRARTIWLKMLESQIETGTPYIGYKDNINRYCNQQNLGTIRSSNLCHEITQYSDSNETAVCNLSSICLPTFVTNGELDYKKLYEIAYLASKNLNKVIDINYYPTPETSRSNFKHRPMGLGIQGIADVLCMLHIPFDSYDAEELNSKIMETIYLAAVSASVDEAKKRYEDMKELNLTNKIYEFPEFYEETFRLSDDDLNKKYHILKPNLHELRMTEHYGSYSTFSGSPFSQGKFQFDLYQETPILHYPNEWNELREEIKKYGTRNSLFTALMPTASTSQILHSTECFEYFTNNIYTRRTMAGDFPLINRYLVNDLKKVGLWNKEMKDMIIENDGSVQNIPIIPEHIRTQYKTIWEIKQVHVLRHAKARSKFVDQAQSMNIFMAEPDNQRLTSSHFWAWKNGLKTGMYYLRSKPATQALKFSLEAKPLANTNKTNSYSSSSISSTNSLKKSFKISFKESDMCVNCSS